MVEARRTKLKKTLVIAAFVLLCVLTVLFEIWDVSFTGDKTYDRLLNNLLPPFFGGIAVFLLVYSNGYKVFGKPQNLLFLIPCIIIAIDNFPFVAYFSDKMSLVHTNPLHFLLFTVYCLSVGLFEELIFRVIVFSILAERFSNDKKGFLKTYVLSSAIFGLVHLFNIFAGASVPATLLQVVYTTLTGGLFAFAFIQTKNVLFAAFIHALYNFCGLLFTSELGLGSGSIIDIPTAITMAVVCIITGGFVLYKVITYPKEEREDLYARLNIKLEK